jgi:hypothetical protein
VCASGIWSLDHGTLYGNLPLAKRCVRPKTRIGSHGCVSMFTAVNLYITLDHKTVKRWCDVQTETVWPGQGLWWLVLAGLRASCRCPSQHLASDVMSVNPRGTQSSGSNMWNVLRHDANWELSSWNNFDSEPRAKLDRMLRRAFLSGGSSRRRRGCGRAVHCRGEVLGTISETCFELKT